MNALVPAWLQGGPILRLPVRMVPPLRWLAAAALALLAAPLAGAVAPALVRPRRRATPARVGGGRGPG